MICSYLDSGERNQAGQSRLVCQQCGHVRWTKTPPEKCGRECVADNARPTRDVIANPCAHVGEETGEIDCPSCGGHVRVKLFACAVYEKATLGKRVPGVACCARCRDYVPTVAVADEAAKEQSTPPSQP